MLNQVKPCFRQHLLVSWIIPTVPILPILGHGCPQEKRMTVQYDVATEDRGFRRMTSPFAVAMRPRKLSLISEEVQQNVNQRPGKKNGKIKDYQGLWFIKDYGKNYG